MKYLVMMAGSWGVGVSIAEADRKARSEGGHGRKDVKRIVYSWDPARTSEVDVDGFGRLGWMGERPTEIERYTPVRVGSSAR